MNDGIVARLREAGGGYFVALLHDQAADEIERLSEKVLELERENERLVDIMRGAAPLIDEFQREAN